MTGVQTCALPICELFIPLGDLIDFTEELSRLEKEKLKFISELELAQSKLSNPGFVAKAPQKLVDSEKEKIEKYNALINDIDNRIVEMKDLING